MKISHRIVFLFLTLIISIGIVSENVIIVKAEDASVIFGSEYYENERGDTFPVGVYITAEDTIGNYYIELKYDNRRLRYVSGADRDEDGILILEGYLDASEDRYWIEFEAISGGTADIAIVTADIELKDTGERFTITEMGQAPIHLSGVDVAAVQTETPSEHVTDTNEPDAKTDTQSEEQNENSQTESEDPDNPESKHSIFTIVLIVILAIVFLLIILWIVYAYLREQRRKSSLVARRAAMEKAKRARMANLQKAKQEPVRSSLRAQVAATKEESKSELTASGKTLKAAVEDVRAASSKRSNLNFDQVWSQVVQEIKTLGLDLSNTSAMDLDQEEARDRNPVIRVENVTMRYKVSTSNASGIKEYIIQRLKHQVSFRTLKALDNVSFNVYKGEVVGIIGTNGSGKSTLLKIVSGALKPTKGRVRVDRRKLQLLTLGTGFDGELTAKENVYLNGSIIGYTKEFLDAHYDDIVEFAELQDFMDEKVKNFSSGMVSRLGFAIATAGDAAEILILDEVLAVGDEFFRRKSLARVKEMIHSGSTVLIVSHNMATITRHCSKVVWIEKGKLMMHGDPNVVCLAYRNQHAES